MKINLYNEIVGGIFTVENQIGHKRMTLA